MKSLPARISSDEFYKVHSTVNRHLRNWQSQGQYRLLNHFYNFGLKAVLMKNWVIGGAAYDVGGTSEEEVKKVTISINDICREVSSVFVDRGINIVSMNLGNSLCSTKRFARCSCLDVIGPALEPDGMGGRKLKGYFLDLSTTFSGNLFLLEPSVYTQCEFLLGNLPMFERVKGVVKPKGGYPLHYSIRFGSGVETECFTSHSKGKIPLAKEEVDGLIDVLDKRFRGVMAADVYLPDPKRWSYSDYYAVIERDVSFGYRAYIYPAVRMRG